MSKNPCGFFSPIGLGEINSVINVSRDPLDSLLSGEENINSMKNWMLLRMYEVVESRTQTLALLLPSCTTVPCCPTSGRWGY